MAICRAKALQTTQEMRVRAALDTFDRMPGGLIVPRHGLVDYRIASTVAVAAGDESITLSLVSPPAGTTSILLEAGTTLEFPGATPTALPILINLAEDATIVVAPTAFDITPAAAALVANVETTEKELRFVHGCKNATVAPQFKIEDSTDYEDGIGTSQAALGVGQQINMELMLLLNDPMHNQIEQLIYDPNFLGLDIFIQITFNNMKRHQGYAKINSATPQNAVQSMQMMQMQVNYQGVCYDFRPGLILTP
jgi:hypothetical protein